MATDESNKERIDRELIELLNELRVALPGVQVLFAFLLTVPFTQRWEFVSKFERDVYFATLLCTAVSSALLIAPSAMHRLLFRQQEKKQLLIVSNRVMIIGLFFLMLAILGVIMLITHVLFGKEMTIVVTAAASLPFLLTWYAYPLARRARSEGDAEDDEASSRGSGGRKAGASAAS